MGLDIVDRRTGKVVDTVSDSDSLRIVRSEQMEYIRDTEKFPFSSFVKLNGTEMRYLMMELKDNQISFLVSLLSFLSYRDNCIKNRRGEPMSEADISAALGIGHSKTNAMINSLVGEHILYKGKNGMEYQLFVNPWIAGKGNRCNKVLSTMFRHYRIRCMGGVKWERHLNR